MPVNSFENYPLSWKPDKQLLSYPYYLSLATLMESDIKKGILPSGCKLPPQRELADYLDLNLSTITRVYNLCREKGLIYGTTGKGTYVSPHANYSITIAADHLSESCIEMGIVTSFENFNYLVTDVIAEMLTSPSINSLYDYSYPAGHPNQLQVGLEWVNSFGILADTEHIAITSGAQNALAIAIAELFRSGDTIATDLYTYSNFIELARIFHIRLVPIPSDEEGMCPFELEQYCRQGRVHGIYLMPSGNNPTNTPISNFRRQELARIIHKYNVIVLEDDINAFLCTETEKQNMLPFFRLLPEQTIYICSTAKSICSGMRIAYMIFGDIFREKLLHGIYNINVKTSSFDAEVITRLISYGKANEIVTAKQELAAQANEIFNQYFPNAPQPINPYCFYRWLPISNQKEGKQLEQELTTLGVRVCHSNRFLVAGEETEHFLRIALSTPGEMERIKQGLQIIKNYLII